MAVRFCGTCGHLRNLGAVQVAMQALQSAAQAIRPSQCVQVTPSSEELQGVQKGSAGGSGDTGAGTAATGTAAAGIDKQ
eukprot:1157161-Pelagomonas_calceolata.AAC.1